MKKALLLLFLFLSISISAQINQTITPYQLCSDPNLPGFATFDLAIKIPEILQNQNPATNNVSFYVSYADAVAGTNPILTPTNYISPYNPFTIYVRVDNVATGELLGITSFQCEALLAPTANPGVLSFCDLMELPIYNLNDADNQITGGNPNSIVTYYPTLLDAQNGTNAIMGGGYIPTVNPGTQVLYTRVQNAATGCSSGITTLSLNTHNCQTCQTPTLVLPSNSDVNGTWLNVNWVENGSATAWHVLILPTGSPAPLVDNSGWMAASSNPFFISGLNPLTSYDLYVRSNCSNSFSDWSSPITITTLDGPPICGGTFTDSGGANGNYSNNTNSTTTICPNVPGDAVTVTFTSFNTEVNQDALYVYNGVNVGVSQISSTNPEGNVPGGLSGGFWGNTIPGPFTSTSQTGCLTFVFRSDGSNTLEGWNADVICTPIVCETPTNPLASATTGTSAILTWDNPSGSTAWELLVLPEGSPEPTAASTGVYVQLLPYVVTGLSQDLCYTAYVRSWCSVPSEWSTPVNFCLVNCENNGNCPESLALVAFIDSNNNGVKDSGETNFNYGNFVYQVNDAGVNQYGNSNNGSYYIFDSNSSNSYDINFAINSALSLYYTSSVSHNNITLPSGSGTNTLYFPVINIAQHVDARVIVTTWGQPRPGFTYPVYINYQNYGSQTIPSGTITFTKDPNVSISNVYETGTVNTPTGFTFDFTNLAPSDSRYIIVDLLLPTIPTVNLGDLITNMVTIQINNDIDLSNNSSSLTQTVVGSYDPNDKMESHGGNIVHSTFTANDYLYYTIQFENTGTASAEFIRVEDALDPQLDENTFEMLSASHNVNTKRDGNQLTWHFYNINLPPTSTNPNDSHGYIHFRIKPKSGYLIGDIIPNTASIYFDYNPAIVTNTFNTEFVQALGNTTFNTNTISLFPNPTSAFVTITNIGTEKIAKIAIYDITGKRIYDLDDTPNTINIDVSHFAKGIYLVELTSDNNSKITKKLILK